MKKEFIIVIFLINTIYPLSLFSQSWQWSKQLGSNDMDIVQKITTDNDNNVYVCGNYKGSSFYSDSDTLNRYGNNDMFLTKYDKNGVEQWTKNFGGNNTSSFNEGMVISYDSLCGCLFLAGSFYGSIDFGNINLTGLGGGDIFIARYDLDGTCVWAKDAGGSGNDFVWNMATDQNHNLCIAGNVTSAASFDTVIISEGVFIAKYDSSGNCIWAKKKFDIYSNTWGIEVLPYSLQTHNNDIYLGGVCEVDTLTSDSFILINANKESMFIACFDSNGTTKWITTGGGPFSYYDRNILIDQNGNGYMSGSFHNYAIFGTDTIYNPTEDFFLAKYDQDGDKIWVKQSFDSSYSHGEGMCNGANGIYVTGNFTGNAHFGNYSLTSTTSDDFFLAYYSDSGSCLGVLNLGTASGQQICIDHDGNLILTGQFFGQITFGGNSTLVENAGSAGDIFIAKCEGFTNIEEQSRYSNSLVIYANPTTGICNITIPDEFKHEKNLTLSLYDNSGKLIQLGKIEMNEEKVRVNLEAEAKGIYNVTLSNGSKTYIGKIIFE